MKASTLKNGNSRRGIRRLRALRLALSRRRALADRAREASEKLLAAGHGNVLRGFNSILVEGKASINMSMAKLIRLLDTGQWLNIYEAITQETGLKGKELEREIILRLKEFGPPRVEIDRLFHFPRSVHYASLNLGGPGPWARYEICCVVLDLDHWAPQYTCFSGDTLRAGFDQKGNLAVAKESLLERFAAGEDLGRLALIQHEAFLGKHSFCLDLGRVRRLLEGEDTMIELHLFGKVNRDQIREVRLPQAPYERLCELVRQLDRNPGSTARELDSARLFRALLDRLDRAEIPLVVCGDS
jgi:hypothetical protein